MLPTSHSLKRKAEYNAKHFSVIFSKTCLQENLIHKYTVYIIAINALKLKKAQNKLANLKRHKIN